MSQFIPVFQNEIDIDDHADMFFEGGIGFQPFKSRSRGAKHFPIRVKSAKT